VVIEKRINFVKMNNSKNSILLVDPEFDPSTAPDCDLLLKITADSFSYAIIDKKSRQLKAVFDHQECDDVSSALLFALKNDSYLQAAYREVKVSAYTPNIIAVPDEVFNTENLNSYANFFSEDQSDTLYTRPCPQFGFTSIFNLEKPTEELLNTYMGNAIRYEQNAPVLVLGSDVENNALVLDFTVGSFNALLIKDHKLIFQNSFQIENAEEFNYYVLLLIQELGLNAAETPVKASGIIHEEDGFYSCLQKYFTDIKFNLPPASDTDQAILEDMPAHYYSSLLALDLCV
jgi:hypothetical protein